MNDYNLELVRQSPIRFDDLVFYPIEFCYICDEVGYDTYEKLLLPFLFTKDCLDIDEEKLDTINLFEDVILSDESFIYSVAYLLQITCKCDEVALREKAIVLMFADGKEFVVNKNNFDEISNIVMLMNGKEKIKVEKPPKNMSERQKDVWYKLQEGRKKSEAKNKLHIYDIINVCEFGGNFHIPIETINHWSLWKIQNCYKAIVDMKTYNDSLKICLVSGNGEAISNKNHWHHRLMIRDKHEQ